MGVYDNDWFVSYHVIWISAGCFLIICHHCTQHKNAVSCTHSVVQNTYNHEKSMVQRKAYLAVIMWCYLRLNITHYFCSIVPQWRLWGFNQLHSKIKLTESWININVGICSSQINSLFKRPRSQTLACPKKALHPFSFLPCFMSC